MSITGLLLAFQNCGQFLAIKESGYKQNGLRSLDGVLLENNEFSNKTPSCYLKEYGYKAYVGQVVDHYDVEEAPVGDSCVSHRKKRTCQESGEFDGSQAYKYRSCRQVIYSSVFKSADFQQLNSFANIAALPKGKFLVTFGQGSDHGGSLDKKVIQLISDSSQKKWLESVHHDPYIHLESKAEGSKYSSGSATITKLSDGRIMSITMSAGRVYSTKDVRDYKFHHQVSFSEDGINWTKWSNAFREQLPVVIGGNVTWEPGEEKYVHVIMSSKAEEVSGKLYIGAYGPSILESSNGGRTWSLFAAAPPADAPLWVRENGYNITESAIVSVKDQHGRPNGFLAASRVDNGVRGSGVVSVRLSRIYFNSVDKGWSEFEEVSPDNRGWNVPDMIRLSDGRILLCYTHFFKNRNRQEGIRCHLSSDEGRTWSQFSAHKFIPRVYEHSLDQGAQEIIEYEPGKLAMVFHEISYENYKTTPPRSRIVLKHLSLPAK